MKKILGGLFIVGLIAIGLGFVALNLEIFNRISTIYPKCGLRIGEEEFTPDNFSFVEEEIDFDTSPYLMSDYDVVTFPSRDGVNISGFFIPAPVSAVSQTPTVIVTHGFNDCKRRSISLLPASMLHRNDMSVIVIDLRNHGDSDVTNGRMSAGIDERLDVLGAWDWLVTEKNISADKIGVVGYSMGGATIIQAMADEPQIVAGWSDSAFDNIDTVLKNELRRNGLPEGLYQSVWMFGDLFYQLDMTRNTPANARQLLGDRPLYMVHSDIDDLVPIDSFTSLSANVDKGRTWVVDDSEHVRMMTDYAEEYEMRMVEFFRDTLNP